MKKANFTQVKALVVLFAVMFGGLSLNAQTVRRTCGDTMADSGTASGPYNDNMVQTIEVCPTNSMSQVVRIVFNQYDVAAGDELVVYAGKGTTGSVLARTGAGSSVANAPGGGWIDALCADITGCLTLVFTPDNNGVKGAGYVFSVECIARPSFSFPDAGKPTERFTKVVSGCVLSTPIVVTVPAYSDCNGGALIVGSNCASATITNNGNGTITVDAPLGETTLTFTSPLFPDKVVRKVLAVLPTTLTCNDDVNVSLINECTIALTPDMLLENPCQVGDYDIFFTDPHVVIIGTTLDGFPIADFSGVPCGTKLDVKVTRKIDALCGNDFVDICWGQITIEDKVDPILNGGVDNYTIACFYDDATLLGRLNAIPRDGRGATLNLKPSRVPSSIPTDVYDLNLVIKSAGGAFTITENCEASFTVSAWQAVEFDCSTGAFTGLIANANDPIWELMVIEQGPAAVFKSYFRVVKAIDRCGNESNIGIQRIEVTQPDIVFPQPEIELPCGSSIDPIDIFNLWASDPDWYVEYATFIPNFDPTPLDLNGNFSLFGNLDDTYFTNASGDEVPAFPDHSDCGYAIDWTDGNKVTVCNESFKLFREWTVYNWCDGHLELIDVIPQVIKVGDFEAPTLEFLGIVSTGTSPVYDCSTDAHILVDVKDDCSGNVKAYVDFLDDNIAEAEFIVSGGKIAVPNVVIDEAFSFTIRLVDDCRNSQVYGPFAGELTDRVPPVAICESFRAVSMGLDCQVIVPAASFDDGSYDNCGTVSFSVARMDEVGDQLFDSFNDVFFAGDEDVFQPAVTFTKDDLTEGCTGSVRVVFRVQDGSGNVNFCMVSVELQDKIPPVVVPQSFKINCDDPAADDFIRASIAGPSAVEALLNTSGVFSDPASALYIQVDSDNCDNARFIVDAVDNRRFDETCRQGVISVVFQAIDECGNVSFPSSATFTFHAKSDWKMNFPMDAEVYCENNSGLPAASTLDQILVNNGCDFWGLEVNEETFEGESGACFKVVREYHLINWCTWSPNNTEIAVVERPEELILAPIHTVSLRYRDANVSINGVDISKQDGVNDIDDGNEDNDFELDQYGTPIVPLRPIWIYNSFDLNANGSRSYEETRSGLIPVRIPLAVFDNSVRRTRTQSEIIRDVNEANDCDVYDVTSRTDDGDFVVIDRFDFPYQNITAYPEVSQFTGTVQHYVSAQAYGNILYRQILKVNDVTAPVVDVTQSGPYCGGSDDSCDGDVVVKFNVSDLCAESFVVTYRLVAFAGTSDELRLAPDPFGRLTVAGGEYTITGTYPIGSHVFVVTVKDKCANTTVVEIPFEVKDCKAPTPYCIFGLSADLMANGTVELWAADFDAGSFDFCSEVTLTFADPTVYPDSIGRTFRCANGEIGVVAVELWAQDAAGNTAFCETFVNIQANPQNGGEIDQCPTPGAVSIAGAIETEEGVSVNEVAVNLSGSASAMKMTGSAGGYSFVSLAQGYDYTVTPSKDNAPLNGVSTLDLVLISKHILGVELLDSPYKLIAADVNNSGSITTFDMIALRKVILNVESDFAANTSWRFVPADYEFANPANPFGESFPEVMNFNDLESSYMSANFVAIKVGDVNASAVIETRGAAGTFTFTADEVTMVAGETYEVAFKGDLAALSGYQFTMNFAGVELVKFGEGAASADNFGVFGDAITASWNGDAAGEVAFTLVVKATQAGRLSDAVKVSSSRTAAEAYSTKGEVQALALNFVEAGYSLMQNNPNPFKGETMVRFTLPSAQQGVLKVSDVNGRVLQVVNGNFVAGVNELTLNSKNLPAGVLYYTLETADFTASKMMVIVE
ncbi:MAG: T9SS type A sorting domain-containing protein [Saprospiraceae bacterium]|nr:T9SS type A sorting domain-containing protein [Saprospiraceae bacterium]